MVTKTAIITLVSTLLIFVLALSYEGVGGRQPWGNGAAGVTGASANWAQSGGRADWGRGASGFTGASGGYLGSGAYGGWGGNSSSMTGASGSFRGGDGDHDGFDGDD